jgi:hypothetical protein
MPIALPETGNGDILESAKRKETKQCKTYLLLTALCLIAILFILVALLVLVPAPTAKENKDAENVSMTGSPSNTPTSGEDYLMAFPRGHSDCSRGTWLTTISSLPVVAGTGSRPSYPF